MSAKAQSSENPERLDTVKWLSVWLILGCGIFGFYYFGHISLLLRVISLLACAGIAVFIALRTSKGRFAWDFFQDTRTEVRKVVWPTRQETLQMTGVVILMVIVIAIMIWIVDSILFWIVQTLTG